MKGISSFMDSSKSIREVYKEYIDIGRSSPITVVIKDFTTKNGNTYHLIMIYTYKENKMTMHFSQSYKNCELSDILLKKCQILASLSIDDSL